MVRPGVLKDGVRDSGSTCAGGCKVWPQEVAMSRRVSTSLVIAGGDASPDGDSLCSNAGGGSEPIAVPFQESLLRLRLRMPVDEM